jgi:elongation factor Ts
VLLELRTETDFVAKSEPIKELVRDLALHISAMDPDSVDTLMKQPYVKDESKTVEEVIKGAIAKVGENLKVSRFARYQI